jgi:hypothetical protein
MILIRRYIPTLNIQRNKRAYFSRLWTWPRAHLEKNCDLSRGLIISFTLEFTSSLKWELCFLLTYHLNFVIQKYILYRLRCISQFWKLKYSERSTLPYRHDISIYVRLSMWWWTLLIWDAFDTKGISGLSVFLFCKCLVIIKLGSVGL